MRCEIFYHCYYECIKFQINGLEADRNDFGDMEDANPKETMYYCGKMKFVPKPPTDTVLYKYGINSDEYKKVCSRLEEIFDEMRYCSLCA